MYDLGDEHEESDKLHSVYASGSPVCAGKHSLSWSLPMDPFGETSDKHPSDEHILDVCARVRL